MMRTPKVVTVTMTVTTFGVLILTQLTVVVDYTFQPSIPKPMGIQVINI